MTRMPYLLAAGGFLTICLVASARAEPPKPLFADAFDDQLADGWTWIAKKDDGWRIREGGYELKLLAGPETILARTIDPAAAPLAIEVTLTSLAEPTEQYEQAGVTWYHDGKQAFKFVKERIDGKLYVFPGKKEMDAATVQMRLEVRGDEVTALFRPDAKGDFQTAFTGKLPGGGNGQHAIALFGFHGPQDGSHWARFDDFRVIKLDK